ncbi:iron-sulfur cluster-binding protein [bacterium]|nr:iron-sulfur cluster-binding protein [bacterium]
MMPTRLNFRTQTVQSLADEKLQANLAHSLSQSCQKRRVMVESLPDWEQMRDRAAHIKNAVIANLDRELAAFADKAERKGFELLWARDARSARDHIVDILTRHKVRTVVKSKSMLTEEIELNQFLSEHGLISIETDLGEYIAQISRQRPSHITAPIIHLSRRDVGRIMHEKLGIQYTESPEELTAAARKTLRSAFLSADAGISGVNFGLIDEGSLVVVENEGNARLSLSLPPVYIAVMGIERLIPSMADLSLFLTLLTVSATGQRISNYVSIINGPRRTGENDGPDKAYLVLVDNGRTDLLHDSRYRSMLTCIRCGACLNICPVYRKVGGHAYASVYPGPMGMILSPLLFSREYYRDLPFASTLCGACSEVCPVKIPLNQLLLELRADLIQSRQRPWWEHQLFRLFALCASHPRLYRLMAYLGSSFQFLFRSSDGGLNVPRWSDQRYFQPLARSSFHSLKHGLRRRKNR